MKELTPVDRRAILFLYVATVAAFIVTALLIFVPFMQEALPGAFLWTAGALGALGLLLVVWSTHYEIVAPLRRVLMITGASALGIVACIILHNLLYALATLVPDTGWLSQVLTVLEVAYFLCATVVFPATFVIGAFAVIAQIVRTRGTPDHPPAGGLNAAN